jgi:MFS family permease
MAETHANPAGMSHIYRQFMPLFGGLFFCHLGIGMSLSAVPFYVQERLGGGDIAVGAAVTAIALAVVVTRPFAGRLGDRYGYKLIMLLGAALCLVAGALYFVAVREEVLVAVRLLHGVAEGAVFTSGATWLVKLAPEERRGKFVGLFGVSMWTGITLGTLLGTKIMEQGGFSSVWTACVVAAAIGIVLIASKEAPQRTEAPKKQSLFPASAFVPGIALAMGASGFASLASFAVLHLTSRGIEDAIYAFNAYGLAYVGIRLLAGHWPDKYGPYRVAFWSALLEAFGLLLVALSPNLAAGIVGCFVVGCGLSLFYPSLALIVINRTEKSQQGAALGTITSCWDLGVAVWGPITGVVANMTGYPAVFMVTMANAIVAALIVVATTASSQAAIGSAAQPTIWGRRRAG